MAPRKPPKLPSKGEAPLTPTDARFTAAVTALITERTIKAAAASVGVDQSTLRRWMDRTDFADAVRTERRKTLAQASTRLVAGCSTAADVLVEIATDTDAPHAPRVAAAKAVLELARDFVDVDDLGERLAALERHVAQNGGAR